VAVADAMSGQGRVERSAYRRGILPRKAVEQQARISHSGAAAQSQSIGVRGRLHPPPGVKTPSEGVADCLHRGIGIELAAGIVLHALQVSSIGRPPSAFGGTSSSVSTREATASR
jgi:hypothetical protein